MQLIGIAAIVPAVPSTLATLALLIADVAPHEPADLAWTWRAPDGCPDAATTRLELRTATTSACTLAADADLQRTPTGWRLDLEIRTCAQGVRSGNSERRAGRKRPRASAEE